MSTITQEQIQYAKTFTGDGVWRPDEMRDFIQEMGVTDLIPLDSISEDSPWDNPEDGIIKDITYTSPYDGQSYTLDYEGQDSYNDLLHTDPKFAQLTIDLSEMMLREQDGDDDAPWEKQFVVIREYLESINKYESGPCGLGFFRIT